MLVYFVKFNITVCLKMEQYSSPYVGINSSWVCTIIKITMDLLHKTVCCALSPSAGGDANIHPVSIEKLGGDGRPR